MKHIKTLLIIVQTFLFCSLLWAQQEQPIPEVKINFEKAIFESVLPFDTKFFFTGDINTNVTKIEIKGNYQRNYTTLTTWKRTNRLKEAKVFYAYLERPYLEPNETISNVEVKLTGTVAEDHPFIQVVKNKLISDFRSWSWANTELGFSIWQKAFIDSINNNKPSNVEITLPSDGGILDTVEYRRTDKIWEDAEAILEPLNKRRGYISDAIHNTGFIEWRKETVAILDELNSYSSQTLNLLYVISKDHIGKEYKNSLDLLESLVSLSRLNAPERDCLANGVISIQDFNGINLPNYIKIEELWDAAECIKRRDRLLELNIFLYRQYKALEDLRALIDLDASENSFQKTKRDEYSYLIFLLDRLKNLIDKIDEQSKKLDSIVTEIDVFNKKLADLSNQLSYSLNESLSISNTTTIVNDIETASKLHVSLDFGVATLGRKNYRVEGFEPEVFLYTGANIYLRPINRKVQLKDFGKMFSPQRLKRSISFTLGVTLKSINIENQRKGIIDNSGLITGIGWSPWRSLKIGGGVMWHQKKDPNPVIDKYDLGTQTYISLSVDVNALKALEGVAKALGINF